ncbi:DUF4383 domain-containing protein [Aerosakkonemataceae cyanobacterium BLCC-F50]|uniref:DUF4383 domain-containing protein n=1 Tax=Floridaenema flaviceps BLCC-F50 TaxID=3153642 RepID=A0ABV4XP11_9CYAN
MIDCFVGIAKSIAPYNQNYTERLNSTKVGNSHLIVLCIGLLGIASFTNLTSARLFNRAFAIAYVLIALMGLLPVTNTTFGLMPIFGNNVWFNALTAAAAGYYGFFLPTEEAKFST